jgi:Uncharacterized conserved protein
MKLYIKQKVFSWTDSSAVYDAEGNTVYSAEGELFSWGKKLHITDALGAECAYIEQQIFSFLPRFHVFREGREIAEVVREFSLFYKYYTVTGPNWEVEGDFLSHDYSITKGGRQIVSVHKEWLTWGDCYELNVVDGEDVVLALCVAFVIDFVLDAQQRSN